MPPAHPALRQEQPAGWLTATIFLVASVFSTAVVGLWPIGADGRRAVVFPPTWSAERSLLAAAMADVAIVAPGGFDNVFIVETNSPDAAAALRRNGAWLFINAAVVEACLGRSRSTTSTLKRT